MVIMDFKDQKISEQKLDESERKYLLLFNGLPLSIILINIEGEIIDCNPNLLKTFGYSADELIGKNFREVKLFSPEYLPLTIDTLNRLLNEEYLEPIEIQAMSKNGNLFWVKINISIQSIGGKRIIQIIFQNIDNEMKAIQRLKESEEKYRLISENINDLIAILNSKLIYEYINEKTTQKLMGYCSEDIIGKPAVNFIHPEDIAQATKIWSEGLKAGEGMYNIRFKHKDGHWVWLEVRGKTFLDNNGEPKGLVVSRDISERKNAEELKEKFREKLEGDVKIRTQALDDALNQQRFYIDQILKSSQFKSDFLSKMSHEISTPLNAIIGFTELLLEGSHVELSKEQSNFLIDIKSSAKQLLEMLLRIFTISKIDAGQFKLEKKEFSLNIFLEQINSTMLSACLKKGLRFNIIGLKPNTMVYADPTRLKEIISNLLDNAIKYTPEGQIDLIIQEDFDFLLFIIKDTGIGIDPKDFDLIFQDFKKIENPLISSSPGVGLGLSIAKRLVNLHGGDIWVESELGKRNAFYFTIPKRIKHIALARLQELLNLMINYFPITQIVKIDQKNLTIINKSRIKLNPNLKSEEITMIRNEIKQMTNFVYGLKLFQELEKKLK